MIKKTLIILFFLNIFNCSNFKNTENKNFTSSFSLTKIKKNLISKYHFSNNIFQSRKFHLHPPKIDESIKRNNLYDLDKKFSFTKIQEPNYSFLEKNPKNNSKIFKVGIEDQQRKRLPFEEPQNQAVINRKATLELGFKTKEDYVFFVKGNVADVNIDNSQNLRNQLNFNLNNQFDSVKFGILVNF